MLEKKFKMHNGYKSRNFIDELLQEGEISSSPHQYRISWNMGQKLSIPEIGSPKGSVESTKFKQSNDWKGKFISTKKKKPRVKNLCVWLKKQDKPSISNKRKPSLSKPKKLKFKTLRVENLGLDFFPKKLVRNQEKKSEEIKKQNKFDSDALHSMMNRNRRKISRINKKFKERRMVKLKQNRNLDFLKKKQNLNSKLKETKKEFTPEKIRKESLMRRTKTSRKFSSNEQKPIKIKYLPSIRRHKSYRNSILGVEIPACLITNFSVPKSWKEVASEQRMKIFKNSKRRRSRRKGKNRRKNIIIDEVSTLSEKEPKKVRDFKFNISSDKNFSLTKQLFCNRSVEKSLRDDLSMFYQMRRNAKKKMFGDVEQDR